MTRDDDFIRQLESYLDHREGSTPLPGSVRYAIRAQLPTIRQSRRAPMPWLVPMTMEMPSVARYGLVAAAMSAAIVFGASLFGRGIGTPADATPTPLPIATPGALPSAASLEPGTYVMANPYLDEDPIRSCDLGCSDYQTISFTVPAGWATENGLIYKHLNEPTEVAFSAWTPGDIYLDPCRWQTSEVDSEPWAHTDSPTGEIVLDDQYPLMNQARRQVGAPANVMLGGQRALRIELSIPADLDIAGCDQGQFRSWTEWDLPGGANSHHAPGQVDVVYFVDVDRRPLFIDASHMPAASATDLAELEAILDSMVIDRGF